MTRCVYSVPDGPPSRRGPLSTAADFRKLTPIVLMRALEQATTVVCEPTVRISLEAPTKTLGALLPALVRPRCRGRDVVGPRRVCGGRDDPVGGADAPPPAAATGPHGRRGRPGVHFRRLSPGQRRSADAPADDAESAQPCRIHEAWANQLIPQRRDADEVACQNARASDGVAVTLGDPVGRVSYAVAFFVSAERLDCLVDAIWSLRSARPAG